MRIAKHRHIQSIAFGFASAALLPWLAHATETAEATANGKIVVPNPPTLAIFYDYKGVSAAGATVFNPVKGDLRVSRLPKPPSSKPASPGDDGNKNPIEAETEQLKPILSNLFRWTRQSNQLGRDALQKAIKMGLDNIKPGGGNFNEVSKEVQLDDFEYLPLKAVTDEVVNNTAKVTETAKASAIQEKIVDFIRVDEDDPIGIQFDYPELKTEVTSKTKDIKPRDGINPTAVGFAKNRDPFGVTWLSSETRELTIDLAGLELSSTTSTTGASALAFSYMDIILVDGTDDVGATTDELSDLNPFTRKLFSLDLWISSIAGVSPVLDVFNFRFDDSVMVSDNYGHSGMLDVVNGFYNQLIDNDYKIFSPYLLTLTFGSMEGADPLRSVMYVQNYSGAATGFVPEPTTLTLMGLGLAGIGFARKKNQI